MAFHPCCDLRLPLKHHNNSWRAYVRDPRAPSPRTLDTALLLCEGHGLLLAPPHVEEFLSGERRALLGGLDPDRSGCVCEVLTPEEWDALTLVSLLPHTCDLGCLCRYAFVACWASYRVVIARHR